MTEREAVAQAADRYRGEGFTVTLDPDPAALPAELRGRRLALLATHNGTSVAVEVWSRDRVNDLPPTFLPAGWEFDVISLPAAESAGVPGTGLSATPDYARELLAEFAGLPGGATRARFLLAWSAVEAGLRVAAARIGIDLESTPTRQFMTELTSAGVLSPDQYGRLRDWMAVRSRLIHGVPEGVPTARDVDDLADLAKQLVTEEGIPVG